MKDDTKESNITNFHNSSNLNKKNNREYDIKDALLEFEELKNIALSCVDKNGNPNISAALRAAENKAKIAGLYKSNNSINIGTTVKMEQISIDGEQLKLNIGEDI